MSKDRSVKAALKMLEERSAADSNLMKLLDEIDRAAADDRGEASSAEHARLPYSSDPQPIEPVWN